MKNIALHSTHEKLDAKMVPFAGYMMPVQYEGVTAEHLTVRASVGVFDVSHMGEFIVHGKNALALIQKVTSNDASKLEVGDAQYSCFPDEKNGIVDDLLCYKIKEDEYLLVVNASNIEKDWNWISKYNEDFKAGLKDVSEDYSLLAIQGPKAVEAMQALSSLDLATIPFYKFKISDFAGVEDVIISATGYTGSGGFEIYCKNGDAEQIWKKVLGGWKIKCRGSSETCVDNFKFLNGECLRGKRLFKVLHINVRPSVYRPYMAFKGRKDTQAL